MTRQVINNGAYVDDPASESIYAAFNKVNSNSGELYELFQGGEYRTNGELVYPAGQAQSVNYNADGTIDFQSCTYLAKTWTLSYVYTSGNVTQLQSTDGTNNWTRDFTYNGDGTLATDGGWVKI